MATTEDYDMARDIGDEWRVFVQLLKGPIAIHWIERECNKCTANISKVGKVGRIGFCGEHPELNKTAT